MKYAVTDYDGCEYITAGKRYEVINSDANDIVFSIIDDTGHKMVCLMKRNSNFNWRIEMNNDIEQQGNDFEVKVELPIKDMPDEIHATELQTWLFSSGFAGRTTKYIRADLVSQKQPEMSKSDVTRLDVELRDWYAKTALQSVISNTSLTPKQMTDYANSIADLMMEARKVVENGGKD